MTREEHMQRPGVQRTQSMPETYPAKDGEDLRQDGRDDSLSDADGVVSRGR